MNRLPEDEIKKLKKRNRLRRLTPRVHKIAHESGRSTKYLWSRIIEKAKGIK